VSELLLHSPKIKLLNFIYPFKFYSNFTNKNVSWLHFSWATQYIPNIWNGIMSVDFD